MKAVVNVVSTYTVWARLVKTWEPVLLDKREFTQQGLKVEVGMKIDVEERNHYWGLVREHVEQDIDKKETVRET